MQKLILVCTAVVLVSKGLWFNLVGYSPAFTAVSNEAVVSVGRFGFMAASALFMVIFALLGRRAVGLHTPLFPLAPILMFMGTGMFGVAPNQSLVSPEGMYLTGGILMGIGNAWGTLCTYSILSRVGSLWQVVVCFAIASSITTLASAFVQGIGAPGVQVSIALALVVVMFVGLLVALRLVEKHPDPHAVFPPSNSQQSPGIREQASATAREIIANRGLLLQLAMITIAMIALRGSSNGGVWGDQRINGSMFAGSLGIMVVVFLVVSLVAFRVYFKTPSKSRYQIPLLVLIGCFLLLSFVGESIDSTLRITLNSAIELFCQLVFTFAIIDSMRKIPASSIAIAGLATGFSWVLALLWMLSLESIGSVANSAIVLVAYLLVVLVASPGKTGDGRVLDGTGAAGGAGSVGGTNNAGSTMSSPGQERNANPFDTVIEQSRVLSQEYRLTNREGEILELLAQGRSVPYICKELVLAEGTVRTHMTRIYKKLGIHSKQELFDLLIKR